MGSNRLDPDEKQAKIQKRQRECHRMTGVIAVVCLALILIIYMLLNANKSSSLPQPAVLRAFVVPTVPVASAKAAALQDLQTKYLDLDQKTRAMKATGVIMETDPASLQLTKQLQAVTTDLLYARYGRYNSYRVKLDLEFQPSIPDYVEKGKDGSVVIELAPIHLIPVSVYTFLEVARTWKGGEFHRNAGHVLQATARSAVKKSLPFQEYSAQHPHKKYTTGYCGRPSGPCFYISIMDNTGNHGPGTQQDKNPYEADANFGRIVQGVEDGTVARIHSTPGIEWLDAKDQIKILRMTIMVPDGSGAYKKWVDKQQ
jgi:hypothetical protein